MTTGRPSAAHGDLAPREAAGARDPAAEGEAAAGPRAAGDPDAPAGAGARDGTGAEAGPEAAARGRATREAGARGSRPGAGEPGAADPGSRDDVPVRWGWVWTAWAGVAVVFAGQNVVGAVASGSEIDWGWAVGHEVLYWAVWAALTPLVFRHARVHRVGSDAGWRAWGAHAALALAIAPSHIAAAYLLHGAGLVALGSLPASELGGWLAERRAGFLVITVTGLWKYAVVVGAYYVVDYSRRWRREREQSAELAIRAARLEGQLARSRLEALRSQLRPHFLFNTLNSIAVLAGEAPERAEATLRQLSGLLRETLAGEAAEEVPLEEELDFLERYLSIQKTRYEERLRVETDVDPGARQLAVPFLILQPVVENAVAHGVERRAGGAVVRLTARRDGDRLELTVEDRPVSPGDAGRAGPARGGHAGADAPPDRGPAAGPEPGDARPPDGPGDAGTRPDGPPPRGRSEGSAPLVTADEAADGGGAGGTGLANVRERLEQLYGEGHRFEAGFGEKGAFVVRIVIPAREPDRPEAGEG